MKITEVEALYLKVPEIKDRTDSSQDTVLIRVSTDAGIVGYGEVDSSPAVARAIIDAARSHRTVNGLKELLLGEDPFATEYLWDKMYRHTIYYGRHGAVIQAMAGVDLALWDIKGKALGQPVWRLVGGGFHQAIQAYASHMFEFTPEATAERAARARDMGFRGVKFGWEPMGPDPALDEALVRAIRQAVGDQILVMIDAGLAWDAKTAIQRCTLFEPYNIYWLEEPLSPDDLRGYERLSRTVSTRIAAGEEESTPEGFRRLMDEGRIDVVQVDVTRTGFTNALVIAKMAARRGLPVCNHAFTTDLNVRASLHFLNAIPNALFLEYCVEPGDLTRRLTRNPVPIQDGFATMPEEPGFGGVINEETVARFLVR